MEKTSGITGSGRIVSIDILRCIAIIGMIMSANIGFFSDLPGWMFHAQTPPPTYEFNPDNPGLTWVDLVFPFFLLSMGAALPFSLRRKLASGTGMGTICMATAKRWAVLTAFALVLGNAYRIGLSEMKTWAQAVFKMSVWAAMCLSLMNMKRLGKRVNSILNITGIMLLGACATLFVLVFKVPLAAECDIIIMILAVASLLSTLVWLLTRNSLRMRWLAIAFIVAVKGVSSYSPLSLSFVPEIPSCIGWCFQWSFLQYMIPVLAGSVIGDMILRHGDTAKSYDSHETQETGNITGWQKTAAVSTVVAAVCLQLWGLYTRKVAADFLLSAAAAVVFMALTRRERGSLWAKTGFIGFALMLCGIMLDPVDGGITKDYCNLSYLLTTSGMGILVVAVLLCIEANSAIRGNFMSAVGQNPMVAYTVTWFIIGPVLTLTGGMDLLTSLAAGSPLWGVLQGAIITLLMMLCTWACTKTGLFWKS